jgi:hypothetical protein
MSVAVEQTPQVKEIVDFLQNEIRLHNLPIILYSKYAMQLNNRLVQVPAFVEGDSDIVDKAHMLQSIEDAWNDRDPEPALIVTIMPATQRQSNGQ